MSSVPVSRPVDHVSEVDRQTFEHTILPAYRPVVLKGLVSAWPVIAEPTPAKLSAWLRARATPRPLESFVAPHETGGRFFYQEGLSGLNFSRRSEPLAAVLDRLMRHLEDARPPAIYIGAAAARDCLVGFERDHVQPLLDPSVEPRIWIGNATTVSTHYDLSDNIACVVAGRRRFTLFPPDQLPNLYVGPLDFTLAGQPVSMVSLNDPDLDRYPRFAQALEHAVVAELEPGDALYIPPLWWHQVESLTPLNMLVNYWWNAAGTPNSPFEALIHSIMTVRHLPEPQRQAWRGIFDHYVFETGGNPVAHLPPDRRGVLGPMTPSLATRVRTFLMNGLRR